MNVFLIVFHCSLQLVLVAKLVLSFELLWGWLFCFFARQSCFWAHLESYAGSTFLLCGCMYEYKIKCQDMWLQERPTVRMRQVPVLWGGKQKKFCCLFEHVPTLPPEKSFFLTSLGSGVLQRAQCYPNDGGLFSLQHEQRFLGALLRSSIVLPLNFVSAHRIFTCT